MEYEKPVNQISEADQPQAPVASPSASAGSRVLSSDLRPEDMRRHWAAALIECVDLLHQTSVETAKQKAVVQEYAALLRNLIFALKSEMDNAANSSNGVVEKLRQQIFSIKGEFASTVHACATEASKLIADESRGIQVATAAFRDALQEDANKITQASDRMAGQFERHLDQLKQAQARLDARARDVRAAESRFQAASLWQRLTWALTGKID